MRTRKGLALVALATVFGLAALRGRLRRYEIAERSMEPALRPGDYVVARLLQEPLGRGQIVIFTHPEIPAFDLVKRVIGLPGELIVISNGHVHANDAVVAEPWADGPTLPDGRWQLGDDEVFLLGDNRAISAADSRTIGPVPANSIRWEVVARYWPLRSSGRI